MSRSSGFELRAIAPDGTVQDCALPAAFAPVIEATRALYARIGHEPPWVSYVAISDEVAVGGGAFVGAPRGRTVEIAYFTLEGFERQGFAARTAAALVEIARRADATVTIEAKTLPEPGPSTRILARNGFRRAGVTTDHEIGEAWLWILDA